MKNICNFCSETNEDCFRCCGNIYYCSEKCRKNDKDNHLKNCYTLSESLIQSVTVSIGSHTKETYKQCEKCKNLLEDWYFYPDKNVCKYCFFN